MADLPSLANNVVQIKAPTPGVSPGQVAAPFQQLGANLDKAGEITKDISVDLAEQAGHQAVTRDDDGNLTIRQAPIIGPAAGAYMRAARNDYLARKQPELENKATEFQLKFRGDPSGFKAAWDKYSKETLAKENDPLLKAPIENVLGTIGGHGWRETAVQQNADTTTNALQSLQARLTTLNEQGASLARQGGTATPEYEQLHNDRAAIYHELTQNPIYHYPQERADLELKENRDGDVVQAVVGNVVRTYGTRKNLAAAQRDLNEAFWGPGSESLGLSARKRDAGVAEGLKTLERSSIDDKQAVSAHQATVTEYMKDLQQAPSHFNDVAHNALMQRSIDLGDMKSRAELDASRLMVPLWQAIKGLPAAQGNAVVAQMARGLVPAVPPQLSGDQQAVAAKIEAEARKQGVDPAVAKGIAYRESAFNPAAAPVGKDGQPLSSARGVYQMTRDSRARFDATVGELGTLKNPDGSVSTEYSITVTDPRINGGKPTNIPTLVKGQVAVDSLQRHEAPSQEQQEIAIRRAAQRVKGGADLPSYESIKDAESAATQRSAAGGSAAPGSIDDQVRQGIAQTKENVTALKTLLGRDPTPTEIYLAHYQGMGGAKALLEADPNESLIGALDHVKPGWGSTVVEANPWMKGMATVGDYMHWMDVRTRTAVAGFGGEGTYVAPKGVTLGLSPGQSFLSTGNAYVPKLFYSTLEQMRTQQGVNAERLADQITTMATDRDVVTPETLGTFVDAATSGGKEALIPKVQQAVSAYDAWLKAQGGGGTALAPALEAQIKAAKAGGVDPITHGMLTNLDKMVSDGAKDMEKEPLIEGARRGWVAPINPLDTGNPQAAATEFKSRADSLAKMRMRDPSLGPLKAIGDNEGEAVKTALTQGPPAAAAGFLAAAATLPKDDYLATMSSPAMKAALSGMVRSRDPDRQTAGFSAFDKMWRMDQWGFAKNFGDEVDRLQAWQGLKDAYSKEEIAERLNLSSDPSKVKVIADAKKSAEDEAKSWKPTDIAYQMGTAWGIPATWEVQRHITGSTPDVPPTVVGVGDMADEMMHDFRSIYVGLRTYGVPAGSFSDSVTGTANAKTLATQRLQNKWAVSAVAGNQIMAYPPDTVTTDKDTKERKGAYYPLINGSHDWMQDQLHETIAGIKGPATTVGPGEVIGAGVRTNWTFKGLIADQQTQAEIAAGKPPSYRAVIDGGNGLNEILRDPKTGSDRIYFDPKQYLERAQDRFGLMQQMAKPLAPEQITDQGAFLRNVREAAGR